MTRIDLVENIILLVHQDDNSFHILGLPHNQAPRNDVLKQFRDQWKHTNSPTNVVHASPLYLRANPPVTPAHIHWLLASDLADSLRPGPHRVTLTQPPARYDSVLGEPGAELNYDEAVLYRNEAIRPLFLVIYKP
ncbi:hypothetical protein FOMPIDRAFT_93797 [Fomitopsis schrenkii]|uniref:Uncharacterized protein n=1 Tax=Fomitopsis schrenkii TaxID=2126942 RepID=S8DJG5_FOMSC|nr:hypothetical protein FOMPIDRAFT_93797 [Fomitopsis schrenkii]